MVYTTQEYTDIICVYGFYNGNGRAAVLEYRNRFPNRRVPYHRTFQTSYRRLSDGSLFDRHEAGTQMREQNLDNNDIEILNL